MNKTNTKNTTTFNKNTTSLRGAGVSMPVPLGERILAENIRISNDGHETMCNAHDLIIGGSGSGKTTGYVCSNINNPTGSFVVQDTKKLLYGRYKDKLEKAGYKVYLADFTDPENSYGYNPLEYIRRRPDGTCYETDYRKLATMLLPEQLDSDEPFWQQAAIRFISMLIAFVCEALPEEEQNMKSVVELHHQFLSGPGENLLLNWSIEHPEMYSSRKFVSISATKSAEKMWSSIQEFVNLGLEPFDNIEFEKIFCAEKTIDFHMMSRQKTACFCNVSDHDRSYSVLANIFYAQLLQTLIDDADRMPGGILPIQTRLFFDELAGAGPLPDFDNQVSIIRSRNIAVSIMIQSLSQLDSAYGKARAKSILNNFDTILFLGTNDLESSEFIANHINTLPYTVLNLPVDKAVLITRGKKPRIVDKIMPQNELTGLSM